MASVPLAAVVTTPAIAQTLAQRIHFNTFGGNPVSCAIGKAVLEVIDRERAADLEAKRDRLFDGLVAAGFDAYRPEATYFTTVDIRPVQPDADGIAA